MDEYQLAEKKLIEANPFLLILQKYLKIRIKNPRHGSPVEPLEPTQTQKKFIDYLISCIAKNEQIRVITYKARQAMISTIVEAFIYAYTSRRKGINSCIIASDLHKANYLYDMFKLYHKYMEYDYPHLTPKTEKNNEKKMYFEGIESCIYPYTADTTDAGQALAFNLSHWSEVSLFKNGQDLFNGFSPCMAKGANTAWIMESRGKGIGGFFYSMVMDAYRQQNDWHLFEIYWWQIDYYTSRPLTEETKKFIESTLTDIERNLVDKYNLTHEQLWWRREIIVNDFKGINFERKKGIYVVSDEDNAVRGFREQYPSYLEDGFVASGSSMFDLDKVEKAMSNAPQSSGNSKLIVDTTYLEGYFIMSTLENGDYFIDFQLAKNGGWHIFEWPKEGGDYVSGADVAEGIESSENSGDYDYSAVSIARRGIDCLVQVAEYQGRLAPDIFAEQYFMACIFYNHCVACPEANKDGGTVIYVLKNKFSYPHIYERKELDLQYDSPKETRKLGWLTKVSSRHIMINDFVSLFRKNEIKVRSRRLLSEMTCFVRHPDGNVSAKSGMHDDLIFAHGICIQMHMALPTKIQLTTTAKIER